MGLAAIVVRITVRLTDCLTHRARGQLHVETRMRMNPIVLEGELLTGHHGIDQQHQTVIELGNVVLNDKFAHYGHAWFSDALAAYVDYMNYHFAAEEYLMRQLGFPDFEAHRIWHDEFRLDLSEIMDSARRMTVSDELRPRLARMVETWLSEHLQVADKQLARFAKESNSRENLRLADSGTLRRAGVLVPDIEQEPTVLATGHSIGRS